MQAAACTLNFIIDSASGEHPLNPYLILLKKRGVLVGAAPELNLPLISYSQVRTVVTVSDPALGGIQSTDEHATMPPVDQPPSWSSSQMWLAFKRQLGALYVYIPEWVRVSGNVSDMTKDTVLVCRGQPQGYTMNDASPLSHKHLTFVQNFDRCRLVLTDWRDAWFLWREECVTYDPNHSHRQGERSNAAT